MGRLPCNDWAASGDLLLDEICDAEMVLDTLVAGVAMLPWRVLVFERVALGESRWIAFRSALCREGYSTTEVRQHQVAQVQVGDDWDSYEASRKSRHRQRRRRNAKMLERSGRADFRVFAKLPRNEIEQLMQRGFQVEDRSWKGRAETSAIKNPEVYRYYVKEAQKLGDWDQLELAFLEHEGVPISFYCGWNARGVRYSVKLGYDQAFAKFGPGQQQCMLILQRAHQDPDCKLYDFYGPLMAWNESWATDTVEVSRLIVTPRRGFEKVLSDLYTILHPVLKRARRNIRAYLARFAQPRM
ncbi:GNAT family N-acetyltransferase [Gammaproteobacteria bacterium]|nr:GNAT family N-acetyltransferase [Gammaproteobacteria bacterium]